MGYNLKKMIYEVPAAFAAAQTQGGRARRIVNAGAVTDEIEPGYGLRPGRQSRIDARFSAWW